MFPHIQPRPKFNTGRLASKLIANCFNSKTMNWIDQRANPPVVPPPVQQRPNTELFHYNCNAKSHEILVKIRIPLGNGLCMLATMINDTGSSLFTLFYHEAFALGYGPQVRTYQGQVHTAAGIVNDLYGNTLLLPHGYASWRCWSCSPVWSHVFLGPWGEHPKSSVFCKRAQRLYPIPSCVQNPTWHPLAVLQSKPLI